MAASNNGPAVRRSLESQLDRFDGILDGLAESLNDAVAAAVKETVDLAVRTAIRDAMREIASGREATAAHLPTLAPPSLLVPAVAGESRRTLAELPGFITLQAWLARFRCRAAQRWQRTRAWARLIWQHHTRVAAILLAAVLLGLAAYLAGPAVSVAFLAGLAVSAGGGAVFLFWYRRPATELSREQPTGYSSPTEGQGPANGFQNQV